MKKLFYLLLVAFICTSCEKVLLNDELDAQDTDGNVILTFSPYSTGGFTRAASNITEICNRLNIGIFDSDDAVVKTIAQKSGDSNYGTISLSLVEGTYKVIALGHNKDASVAANSLTDISFSGGPTDVFLYYGTIEVGEETQTYNLSMNRVVSMFKLILTDESIPSGVTKLSVSIAGGSIHINPSTGHGGTTKTAQKTDIIIGESQTTFDIYTFPPQSESTANITVTAKTDDGTTVATKVFENVPLKVNEVTSYRGKLFGGVASVTASSLGFTADPDWAGTNEYTF